MTKQRPTLGLLIKLSMSMEKRAYDFYATLERNQAHNEDFIGCLKGIKEDEVMHLRVLDEIHQSLSDVRLNSIVSDDSIDRLEKGHRFLDELDMDDLKDTDDIIDAIRTLEDVEFDIVMNFVDITEVNFKFTRDFLQNETLDHANRIFRAQQCLD